MSLLIECVCGKKLKVRDELAGKKVKCPGCGKTLVAPTPAMEEPPELLEMLEEDKPPITLARPNVTSSSTDVQRPSVPWDGKKKSASSSKDEGEDKPAPFWVFAGTLSSEVMALAAEGIYFSARKGDALNRAEKLLKNGAHAAQALGEKATYIPWEWIMSIESNQRLRGFTIHYNTGEELLSKSLTPADHATRDDLFKAMTAFLAPAWVMTTTQHTAVTATFLPLFLIAIVLTLTGVLAWISSLVEDGPVVVNRWIGGKAWTGLGGIYNRLQELGPMWDSVIGLIVAALLAIWLIVRVITPPIDMSIHPGPAEHG